MRNRKLVTARVRDAYEQFLSGATPPDGSVRSLVSESWARSLDRGIDPDDAATDPRESEIMSDADFHAYRSEHLLARVRPLIQSLMLDDISDSGVVVALADRNGRLLWVDGDRSARSKAAKISFAEGTVWSEDAVGTNAPGVALALDRSVQISGPEHYAGPVQKWSCTAAPVHDPTSGDLIGVIDVTGGSAAANPFALTAVRSVVAAVERELASHAVDLSPAGRGTTTPDTRLQVLSADPTWRVPNRPPKPLSPRHAEILLLLHAHPAGLRTEQLADLLSDEDLGAVTVRAEISRLRRDVGDVVASRPYRLIHDAAADVDEVRTAIVSGDPRQAIQMFGRGGLLADSMAPGVTDLLDDLRESLRAAVFASGDLAALQAWASSPHGADDFQAWTTLRESLPSGAPEAAIAAGRVRLLNRRFGA
ncbi:helix-turn-helix domain-containing protein [Gordonia zhaorongruii]|uniref:helix-turn-helix domain-containing protein n=1 Tax=Gordonia zhaorongruii TaxID=2597659 RepID=UPI00105239EB|nr:helix-turn-helix domain-containing protein [Gordonia zhaorongruii]